MSKEYVLGYCQVTLTSNSKMGEINIRALRQPFCCPVCKGKGLVPNGFYNQTDGQWISISLTPETCKSCKGTGTVWG